MREEAVKETVPRERRQLKKQSHEKEEAVKETESRLLLGKTDVKCNFNRFYSNWNLI